MDISTKASIDADTYERNLSSHIGPTSSVLPKANVQTIGDCSKTGVSTKYAHNQTSQHITISTQESLQAKHWYALRTTYGREKKAYDYINEHGAKAFLPTITIEKIIKGQKKYVEVSRIPNIFFAYGTEDDIKTFVYDNFNLPFLRFYYKHTHIGTRIEKTPMIVPDSQIRSLQIICDTNTCNDTFILQEKIRKFYVGEKVRITEGQFKGVEGIVARYHGQQRVGLVIEGLLTAITAYVPSAFLEKKEDERYNIGK